MTSLSGRLLSYATRLAVRPVLEVGCTTLGVPWPFDLIEWVARGIPKSHARRETVQLPHCTAQLVHAPGVPEGDSAILYFHGGGFLVCGPNTHAGLITRLSKYANMPVLAVDYRMLPKPMNDAVQDGLDGYGWLAERYRNVAIAGDSAGGYLTLATAIRLCRYGEARPAALAMLSPLLELNPQPRKTHPNMAADAMFGPQAFDALYALVRLANRGEVFEPLDHITYRLPPTTIHVSGSEVLLHDADAAAALLAFVGVEVDLRVWPDQIHVFQIAPWVPEADQSLRQVGDFIRRQIGVRECLTFHTSPVGWWV